MAYGAQNKAGFVMIGVANAINTAIGIYGWQIWRRDENPDQASATPDEYSAQAAS